MKVLILVPAGGRERRSVEYLTVKTSKYCEKLNEKEKKTTKHFKLGRAIKKRTKIKEELKFKVHSRPF